MIQLKKEAKIKLASMNVQVPQVDKDIIVALGDGKLSVGIRMVLYTFREELKKIAEEKAKNSKPKKKVANG